MPAQTAVSVASASAGRPRRRPTPGDLDQVRRRRYYLHAYDPERGWAPFGPVPTIDVEDGSLHVHGTPVISPTITRDHVSWFQHGQDPQGRHYLAGHLSVEAGGVHAHGVVVHGTTHADAIRTAVFATAVPTIDYTTAVTAAPVAPGTDPTTVPAAGWKAGLSLSVSYRQQVGQGVPAPVVLLDDQDVSQQCSWSVNDRYTVLTIALSDSDCQFASALYQDASLSFDPYVLQPTGAGTVRRTCADGAPADGKVWLWRAEAGALATAGATGHDVAASEPLLLARRTPASAVALLSTAADPLGIDELMTILPNDVVNDDANSMLLRNMKWAMGQNPGEKGWLSQFFQEQPPLITDPGQQKLVQQSLTWYQDRFAMAYLTQSFNSYSGPNEPTHRLDATQGAALTNYLRSGLAREKDFTIQHQGIYVDAFVGTQPRLADYLADPAPEYVGWAQGEVVLTRTDTSTDLTVAAGVNVQDAAGTSYTTQASTTLKAGVATSAPVPIAAALPGQASIVTAHSLTSFGPQSPSGIDSVDNPAATTLSADTGGLKWAKKLFTALTGGAQFVLMVNRVAGAAGDPKALGPVNNFACLLTALDSSGTVARNYFQSVISGLIVKLVPSVVHRDADTVMQWLPATMAELLRKLADGELPNETAISAAEAKVIYQEYLKHQSDINLALADLFQSISASGLISQMQQAEGQFASSIASRWPKLAKASRFMLAVGWIGAVSSVIVSLTKGDWKQMTDVERAEFVTNIVQLTVTGFGAVPLIWQGVKYVTLKAWNALNDWFHAPPQQVEIEMQQLNTVDESSPLIRQEGENLREMIDDVQPGKALGEGTIFERIFAEGAFSGVLKCVGALAAAAMAGYSLWQLVDDLDQHGSVTTVVFDSLIFTANLLSAVCLVADLFVATSFLPIAGAVLALAGMVIGIIASFSEKPDNPVDDWMVDHGIPFAAGLPAPPASARRFTRLSPRSENLVYA